MQENSSLEQAERNTLLRAARVTVELAVPLGSAEDVLDYVESALASHGASLEPDHPMHGEHTVRVRGIKLVNRTAKALTGPAITSHGTLLR